MKEFTYDIDKLGGLLKNQKRVCCPWTMDVNRDNSECGSWCALFDVFEGEHTYRDINGGIKKNPNLYIRLNCSHAVYVVKGDMTDEPK